MNNDPSKNANQDSQALLNKIILDYVQEQKRTRRWKWFFRIIFLLLILFLLSKLGLFGGDEDNITTIRPHVGIIDIKGTIFEGRSASADNLAKSLLKAYKNPMMKAMILRINSPGGSPVQADYMYNSVRYYQKRFPDIKVYAVCVDLCASAGYYVAAAADEIYASPSSIVGSIGVLYNGFGLVETMDKLGVSRRLLTAGRYKAFLDPFSPEKPEDKQRMLTMLDLIHQQFISKVKQGRKNRLLIDDETFSGLFWTGQQSLGRGLIDGFASSGQLAREKLKIDMMVDYTYQPNMLELFAKSMGTAMADHLPQALGLQQTIQ